MRGEANEGVPGEECSSLRWFLFCVCLGFIYFVLLLLGETIQRNNEMNKELGKDGLAGI